MTKVKSLAPLVSAIHRVPKELKDGGQLELELLGTVHRGCKEHGVVGVAKEGYKMDRCSKLFVDFFSNKLCSPQPTTSRLSMSFSS